MKIRAGQELAKNHNSKNVDILIKVVDINSLKTIYFYTNNPDINVFFNFGHRNAS